LSEDVVHLLDPEMRDLNMVMHPALALSEQILAWILQALGYADDKRRRVKVSHSTLKNARRGAVIPQSWDALVAGTLEVLGLKPAAELRAGLPGLLRSWDERVGELPATGDLSLAESIHVLLLRAIPELGIRLGAMAAWAAVRTGTPFGEWLWLVEPFATAAMKIPEEIVANSRRLCLSRARVFAERGDASGALDWVGRARHLVSPMTMSEAEDLLATLSAIAHGLLDEYRGMRELLRAVPDDDGAAELRGALLDGALLAERIVTMILEIGEAPEATHVLLATLVAAIPVAIRVAYLRMELSSEDEGSKLDAVDALVARLRACLDANPTHGRGWAVLMLWTARSGPTPAAGEQEKLATHFGARDFLEGEVVRIERDRGLSQDAG
jgi:hypothetical protein